MAIEDSRVRLVRLRDLCGRAVSHLEADDSASTGDGRPLHELTLGDLLVMAEMWEIYHGRAVKVYNSFLTLEAPDPLLEAAIEKCKEGRAYRHHDLPAWMQLAFARAPAGHICYPNSVIRESVSEIVDLASVEYEALQTELRAGRRSDELADALHLLVRANLTIAGAANGVLRAISKDERVGENGRLVALYKLGYWTPGKRGCVIGALLALIGM